MREIELFKMDYDMVSVLPLLKSGLSYHLFFYGVLHLEDCRFLQLMKQLWLKNGLEGKKELLALIAEQRDALGSSRWMVSIGHGK